MMFGPFWCRMRFEFLLLLSVVLLGTALVAVRGDGAGDAPARSRSVARTRHLSCGPAALMVVASGHSRRAAAELDAMLGREAARPVTSMLDLKRWGEGVGLRPVGLRVSAEELSRVPLPAIVHLAPDHFMVLRAIDGDWAECIDQGPAARVMPREAFEERFTGNVLCFANFLQRPGLRPEGQR